jgi:hypothetical protein
VNRIKGHRIGLLLLLACLTAATAQPPIQLDTGAAAQNPHRQLQEIMAQPLFRRWQLRQARTTLEADPTVTTDSLIVLWLRDTVDSAVEVVRDFFEWLFGGLRNANPPGLGKSSFNLASILKTIAWVVLAVLVAVIALLLIRGLQRVGAKTSVTRVLTRQQVREAIETGDALAMAGSQWLAEADRLAQAGEFRAVYRALYLSLLSGLHSAGKINYRRHRTNWTYVTRFRGSPTHRDLFHNLTMLFDEVWYGLKPAPGSSIADLRRQVATLAQTEAGDR